MIARLRDLARFYEKSGRYVDALGIMQRITTLVGATSGMGWYEYADALEDQVQLLTKLKKFDSAVNLYPTIIELRHRTEGNYPGHYTASMETYADLLRMAGNPGLSTQVSKQIESYLLDQLRQSNKYVAGPQTELARYYARQGDLKRACVYYDLVVSDPSCAPRTLGEYAKLLKQLHREKEAAVYLKRMPEQWKRRSE